jgi:putative hydrolase of the HAD superfamily
LFALGLEADYVVSASEVGVLKPHPRGLLKILQLAGEGPETAVLVGDRAERDGESARRAGVKALIRTSTPLPEYVCFQTFDDPLFNGI